jgi:hypothetical protein
MARPNSGFEARNRPDWLYNALPYVYIAVGLTVPFAIGTSNLIAVFSGILLISTGGAVVTMRATHRQELARLRAEFAETDRRKAESRREKDDAERRDSDRREAERRRADRRGSGGNSTAAPHSES